MQAGHWNRFRMHTRILLSLSRFAITRTLYYGAAVPYILQDSMFVSRGATDRRWSVIRTDQSPRFGTHVIRGLTDKFNHHRVKVYHLQVLRFLRSAAAAHTEARTRRERAWEREAWFRYRVSDNASTDGYKHTHKVMLKYPFWQVFW